MSRLQELENNPNLDEQVDKLMVSGMIETKNGSTGCVEVKRGMPVLSVEGRNAGRVAAVIVHTPEGRPTHLLLGHLPEERGYWLIELDLVAAVEDEIVRLSISEEAVRALPRWRSG